MLERKGLVDWAPPRSSPGRTRFSRHANRERVVNIPINLVNASEKHMRGACYRCCGDPGRRGAERHEGGQCNGHDTAAESNGAGRLADLAQDPRGDPAARGAPGRQLRVVCQELCKRAWSYVDTFVTPLHFTLLLPAHQGARLSRLKAARYV